MWFIGDVHGRFRKYVRVVEAIPLTDGRTGLDCSLQVGDMGLGFPTRPVGIPPTADDEPLRDDAPLVAAAERPRANAPILSAMHRFLRGNHDDPAMCRRHPCFLGDFGFIEKMELCFVSGGYSVDRDERTPGVDWWPDEELPGPELRSLVEQFGDLKPRIVASHECPTAAKDYAVCNFAKIDTVSRTERALQAMFELHQPEYWIFGHHHLRMDRRLGRTRFICLNEFVEGPIEECLFEIPGLRW